MKATRHQGDNVKKQGRKSKTRMFRLQLESVLQQKNMNMMQLSRKSDVAYNTIRRMVNEPTKDVSLAVLVRIAETLNVTLADLVKINEPPDAPQ